MKKIAIIGSGPTGIYTFYSLLARGEPLAVSVYEQGDEAGVGMPYRDDDNAKMMLANIASIEIPPLFVTYLDWLKSLSAGHLARYDVDPASLHVRQFLPRLLLGEYFRAQFIELVARARRSGFAVTVREQCQVTDLEATDRGVRLRTGDGAPPELFDLAVVATGHVWPDDSTATRTYFPSPWSGLMEARIPACQVGIMGTSLSGIDAAMAVAVQHGRFNETDDEQITFTLNPESAALRIVLMSRSGILPEADFYCPIPYEPLKVVTPEAIEHAINAGSPGLLDRIFRLMVAEIEAADPAWSRHIALRTRDADSMAAAWFADRQRHHPFHWALANLNEVERNKRDRRTVAWRYAILRLHEGVEEVVPHLDDADRERFRRGLARVFIDNYAAIPSQSIRRLLALREAGVVSIRALGEDYQLRQAGEHTVISAEGHTCTFAVFIDARGQRPLATRDLPFPTLRAQLQTTGEALPDVGEDYTLHAPECVRGRIAFGALPYLMHDRPFVQGITVSAEIGAAIAGAVAGSASRTRRWLPATERD